METGTTFCDFCSHDTKTDATIKVSGETEHPKLPGFVLSFQPADLSAPSWLQRQTDWCCRERPHILASGDGTFVESYSTNNAGFHLHAKLWPVRDGKVRKGLTVGATHHRGQKVPVDQCFTF